MSGSEQRGLAGHDGQPVGPDQQSDPLTRRFAEDASSDREGWSPVQKAAAWGGTVALLGGIGGGAYELGQHNAHHEKPKSAIESAMDRGDPLFDATLDVGGGKTMRIVGVENHDKTVTIATGGDAGAGPADIKVSSLFHFGDKNNLDLGDVESMGGAVLTPEKSINVGKIPEEDSSSLQVEVTPGTGGNGDSEPNGPHYEITAPLDGLKAPANGPSSAFSEKLSEFGVTAPAEGKSGEIYLTGHEQSDGSFKLTTDGSSGTANVDVTAWGFGGEEELGGGPMGAGYEFRTKQMEFYDQWLDVQLGKGATVSFPIKDSE